MKRIELGGGVSLCEMVFGGTKRFDDSACKLQFEMMDRYIELGAIRLIPRAAITAEKAIHILVHGCAQAGLGAIRWC